MNHGLAAFPGIPTVAEMANAPADRKLRFNDLPGFLGDQPRDTASNLSKPE
jgi:hypothetical protein